MNGGEPLDESYFKWLYGEIASTKDRNPERSHWKLARRLYGTKFLYFVPNDDNRAMDGIDLREEFLDQLPEYEVERAWLEMECSVLEMLIALARRADFHSFDGTMPEGKRGWFWHLMDNVGLSPYVDAVIREGDLGEIDKILSKLNNRTYNANGRGGLFPLRRPRGDQRKVELWYQLSAYLLENHYVEP